MSHRLPPHSPILGLGIVWACLSGASARAEDPNAVLKAAGLQRVENSYVLDEEAALRGTEGESRKLETRIGLALKQKQETMRRAALVEQQVAELRARADQLREQAKNDRDQGDRLANEARGLEDRARQVLREHDRTAPTQLQYAEMERKLAADQMELLALQEKYQGTIDQLQKRYDELAGDPGITEALQALNKGARRKAALGPAAAYKENLFYLCADRLQKLGLGRDDAVFHLPEEAELASVAAGLNKTLHDAQKAGKLDAATLKELRAGAAELRGRVDALEARRAKLTKDPEITDLVAEIQKGGRKKVRLGSLPQYTRALKELATVEQATGEKGASPKKR